MKDKLSLIGTAFLLAATLAGTARAEEAETSVEKCSKKFGSIAVAEPQNGWNHLQHYGLGSPAALLRLMIQQSGCFDVVERGVAMQNLQQERALGQSGELRQESNIGKGQMQAADFVLTPNVQVGASDTGGIGGLLAGRLGVFGVIAGNVKFKEASTSILVADVRSSIQVAAAEGKATKTDFGIGGFAWAGGLVGAGGYTKTPEGKVIAASLLDNYNKVVLAIRDQDKLIKTSSASSDVNAAASTRAEAPQEAGQMLQAKIGNVKLYAEPSRTSKVVATLQRSDELVATGESRNGFAKVDAANFSGWVQRTLVMPGSGATSFTPQSAAPVVHPVSAPMGIYGTFSGSFGGSEQGSFLISVKDTHIVSGSGASRQTGQFDVQGNVDPRGGFAMSATGAAGTAVFTGRIDGATGAVAGTWRYANRSGGGTFNGQRQ